MPSEVATLVLAGGAISIGALVALALWRRGRRRRRVSRSPHPSARPPVHVSLAAGTDGIEVSVPPGAPDVAVDIVSFRRLDPPGQWEPALHGEPVVVEPGGRAVFRPEAPPSRVGAGPVDVVVAWTARHATGSVPGSRLFRLPPERDAPAAPPSGGLGAWPTLLVLVLLAASGAVVVASLADGTGDDDPSSVSAAPVDDLVTDDGSPSSAEPAAVSTIAASAPPTAPATPTTTDASTATTATTATSTVTAVTTSTTVSPSTTAAPPVDGPVVDAVGRIEPCRFGDECLVVGFTIDGFDEAQSEYVCEFDDGTRVGFGFVGDGAETACSTGNPDGAIVVEVAGVRSEPATRPGS